MKKQIRVIIILAAVLAVLVAGNIIIKKVSNFSSEKRERESEEESIANTIFVNDFETLSSISFGGFSFSFDEDAGWVYDEDASFPLDSDIIQTLADEFAGFTASRKIEDGDTLESYGLEEPAYTVELKSADGSGQTIYIGSSYNGEYYVKDAGDDTVYTCSLANMDTLDCGKIEEFALVESVNTLWNSTYYSFLIESGDSSILLTRDRSVDVFSEDETDENGDAVPNVVWDVSLDGGEAYDVTGTQDLSDVRNALDVAYDGCLAYNPDDDTYAEYGFDEPEYVITIGYTDEDDKDCELVLTIGAYDEETETYSIMSGQSDIIYSISSSKVTAISDCFDYDFIADEEDTGSLAE